MKKQGLLAASIAVALVGCGSDSDSSGPTSFSITAIDGYLGTANVSVDFLEEDLQKRLFSGRLLRELQMTCKEQLI